MNSCAEMRDLESAKVSPSHLCVPSEANIDEEKISVLAPIARGCWISRRRPVRVECPGGLPANEGDEDSLSTRSRGISTLNGGISVRVV